MTVLFIGPYRSVDGQIREMAGPNAGRACGPFGELLGGRRGFARFRPGTNARCGALRERDWIADRHWLRWSEITAKRPPAGSIANDLAALGSLPARQSATRPNDWAMAFGHDQLTTGRRLRGLTMIDTFLRFYPPIEPRVTFRANY